MKSKEKTIQEYKAELVEFFSSAQEVRSFRELKKNQAMWELLNSGYIVPISPSLWMATTLARGQHKWV